MDNSRTLYQIKEDVLMETVKDISQTEPGERFEYVVVENDSSQKVGDKMEYPEVGRRLSKKSILTII
ncbi:13990_t:CDS:2 [Funneliformis geosporum]|uniref:13990_t:CDS:1 n=1 Tax=Funneliformis geosporum TaxID=1117311 RepID=A0A9W4T6G1_9GLOM|nr:13990_t:CDS:2 [Funneliformis geosporum]